MILVRNIFHLKFGKAKEAKAVFKEGLEINKKMAGTSGRVLTDLTGNSYTLVLELTFESLADLEQKLKSFSGTKEWGDWYQKVIPLAESASREIFNIEE